MSERLRLFVALDLPAVVRSELAGWCARVAPSGVRLVPEANLHVTLAFLGSRSADEAAAVGALLAPLAGAAAVGPLVTAGALWLPRRRPGVLTVALAADEGLSALQAELVAALEGAIGFEPERRAFRPHVTVGRVKHGAGVSAVALEAVPATAFRVEALTLYRSRSGPGGSSYEALERAGLPS